MENNSLSVGNGRSRHPFIFSSLCFLLLIASATGSVVVNILRDNDGISIVSDGRRFELGFFTPEGVSDATRRYLGIWFYGSKPRIVVWVANRDQPLYDRNGIFAIRDGNLMVSASTGTSLWSTNLNFSSNNATMELMPSGNLILKESGNNGQILWQSFQNPTDTLLPGMKMTDALKLTSWKSSDDPSPGNFTFLKNTGNRYVIEKLSSQYWVSKDVWQNFSTTETEEKIDEVIDLLSNVSVSDLEANNYSIRFQNQKLDFNYTRAVMDSNGRIQYVARNIVSRKWEVIWSEPGNNCSLVSTCGNFASCETDTKHICRCLPGFEPKSKDEWDSGDYSHGCQRITEICFKESHLATDFLTIIMKVKKTSNTAQADHNQNCRTKCLESCKCQAYAEVTTNYRTDGTVTCAIWDDELQNIWEYAEDGGIVNIRVKRSDIGMFSLAHEGPQLFKRSDIGMFSVVHEG